MINSYIYHKVCGVIGYSFPNFNGVAIEGEGREWEVILSHILLGM